MSILSDFRKISQAFKHTYASHDLSAPIIKAIDATVQYETGVALDRVTFDLPRAVRLAIVGPNGAGKSTLLKLIAGLLNPTSGEINIFGAKPGGHICVAYVPQRSQVDWTFPVTVRDVVMMGRIGKVGILHRPGKQDWYSVDHALEVVGLSSLEKRQISELSGGQQQRMFIARALAQEAELMLMDEPLTGLDMGSQKDIFNIISTLNQAGVTILVSLHDLGLAAEHFDSVMLLNHSLIGLGKPADVFSDENLVRAYGIHHGAGQVDLSIIDDTCCCTEEEHHHA